MKACLLRTPARIENNPLEYGEIAEPKPDAGEVLVRVNVCGVCRTDLHVIEGELPPKKSPVIPGHQVVGTVERREKAQGDSRRVRAWASPGCTKQTGRASTAAVEKKTCAMHHSLPVTPWMAATRNGS